MHSTFIGIQVFLLSATTNNPAMNILACVFGVHQNTFGCIYVGYVVRSGFTRSKSAYVSFSKGCQTMSQGGCTNKLLLKAYESFHCSTSLSTLQALVVFTSKFAVLMGIQSSLIVFLICDSQMTNVVFIDSLAVWISSWDVPGQDFRPFFVN